MTTKTLRFNRNLYSQASIKKGVFEYQNAYGKGIKFQIKNIKNYTEVVMQTSEGDADKLADEFSNFLLFININ
jgi:hypothetical protein